ncbi:GxGYxYP putative glycoside hydrolase C-terminal domain [Pelomyxa schiedti]|nr:GxGYxYP putative glycoside hydrolase C-terminal domain [Pelomyxa schiedti]
MGQTSPCWSSIPLFVCLLLAGAFLGTRGADINSPLMGTWLSDASAANSSAIPYWEQVQATLSCDSTYQCEWSMLWGSDSTSWYLWNTTLAFGIPSYKPVTSRLFPENIWIGVEMKANTTSTFYASWGDDKLNSLLIEEKSFLRGSQGTVQYNMFHNFTYSGETNTVRYSTVMTVNSYVYSLWYLMRPTTPIQRETTQPIPTIEWQGKPVDRNILKSRAPRQPEKFQQSNNYYWMQMVDEWTIDGSLPEQAFTIGLQGLANRDIPQLYLVYGPNYKYIYSQDVFNYYVDERGFNFTFIGSNEEALKLFIDSVAGYVIWDKNIRESLVVAFTFAGLYDAVIVTEDMLDLVQNAGLKLLFDFRGLFTGMSDLDIYTWAYNQYWSYTNKEMMVWMGGPCGNEMVPGIADWGVKSRMFFSDLSTRVTSPEYALSQQMLFELDATPVIFGWHNYCKDLEREYTTLISSTGGWVHGLAEMPDVSFMNMIPLKDGMVFKNNPNPDIDLLATDVYITQMQTDGMGIGAWNKEGRGDIPCAWEVNSDDSWIQPTLLEFFFSQATSNDYMVNSLSGPGYLYPKASPSEDFPILLELAVSYMEELDLHSMSVMDDSEGSTVTGNQDLTPEIVNDYFTYMPNAFGYANGYTATFTFAQSSTTGAPFVSYDYYVDPDRTEEDVVSDLQLLAAVNSKRPYFMVMHVRETNSINRIEQIVNALGPDFHLVPFDSYFRALAQNPTFETHYKDGLNA